MNKKIKNATPFEFDNIHFKSKLEVMTYKTLKEAGFLPQYEPTKFIIWEGFKPTIPFYNKDKNTKQLKRDSKKLINITYCPDFVFEYKNHTIIMEIKGFENDLFPIKKKLFRAYLEKNMPNSLYFEVYTKKQLLQAITIIKEL